MPEPHLLLYLGMTVPWMCNVVVRTLPLVLTLTVFLKAPGRPMGLKVTLILPFLPGLMGLVGYSGRVQPHEAVASMISRGFSPVLMNSKVHDTGPLASLMVPKSWV